MQNFVLPVIFVILYGSGFVGAKYGLPYSPPLTFLILRFLISFTFAAGIALVLKAPWPSNRQQVKQIAFAGVLTVGTFSAGAFVAIHLGLSPALVALIIALQPLLVAVFAQFMLMERFVPRQWLGLTIGFAGVILVVFQKLRFDTAHLQGVAMATIALLGLSFGNLYQKRYCSNMNIFTDGAIQSAASMIVLFPLAVFFESMQVQWTKEFIGALSYMAIVVSIGALSLLYVMIKRSEISRVASVFYLVPVSAACLSFFIYGDAIDIFTLFGACLIAASIVLVNKKFI